MVIILATINVYRNSIDGLMRKLSTRRKIAFYSVIYFYYLYRFL